MNWRETLARIILAVDIERERKEKEHYKSDKEFLDTKISEYKVWLDERDQTISELREKVRNLEMGIGIEPQKQFPIIHNLSLDANKALAELAIKKALYAKDIEKTIKCGRTKAWGIMKELEKANLVIFAGSKAKPYIILKEITQKNEKTQILGQIKERQKDTKN